MVSHASTAHKVAAACGGSCESPWALAVEHNDSRRFGGAKMVWAVLKIHHTNPAHLEHRLRAP